MFPRSIPLLVMALVSNAVAGSLERLPETEWTLASARHLLDRAGFGGTPEQIAALHALGLEGAVDSVLAESNARTPDPPFAAELIRKNYRAMLPEGADPKGPEAQQLRKKAQAADRRQFEAYREFWLGRMIETEHPLREKMALFWHGYFTSAQREVRDSYAMARQIELYRGLGLSSFRELLHRASKEPAMLEYLNNDQNKKQAPNENFAREVMELFTMGPGNYSESDIHAAARAFTGWSIKDGEFVFLKNRHDFGVKEFLGAKGEFGGEDVLDRLLEQDATPRFVSSKLCVFFVRPDPSPQLVDALAAALRSHDYALAPFLREVFLSREFYATESSGALFKSPIEFVVSTTRRLAIESPPLGPWVEACEQLGQALLNPPNVKGWDGGEDWISASTLLLRANVARAMVLGRDAFESDEQRGRSRMARNDEADPLGAKARRQLRDHRPELPVAQWVADCNGSVAAVKRLCDRLLPVAPSRQTVTELAHYAAPYGDDAFDVTSPETERLLRDVVHLILCLPEYQLN